MATFASAHGADYVVPDNEDSGGPPLPHRGYPMWASKKKGGGILGCLPLRARYTDFEGRRRYGPPSIRKEGDVEEPVEVEPEGRKTRAGGIQVRKGLRCK